MACIWRVANYLYSSELISVLLTSGTSVRILSTTEMSIVAVAICGPSNSPPNSARTSPQGEITIECPYVTLFSLRCPACAAAITYDYISMALHEEESPSEPFRWEPWKRRELLLALSCLRAKPAEMCAPPPLRAHPSTHHSPEAARAGERRWAQQYPGSISTIMTCLRHMTWQDKS